MNYLDSTIRVGYYHAFGLEFADHTYAMIDHGGETWAFPCFGGVAETEGERGYKGVKYPVDMWTPYTFGSRNVGSTLSANLHVALGMAQFSASPSYNFRKREWDAYWDSGKIDGAASWAGLIYGVSGVCQQACNRILWSTRDKDFTECPVNWPPSFSKSYWVYGYWGKTSEALALELARTLVAQAYRRMFEARRMNDMLVGDSMGDMLMADETPTVAAPNGNLSPEALLAAAGREAGAALRTGVDRAERREEIREMVETAPASEKVLGERATSAGVLEIDARFQTAKTELDTLLLRGEIARQEYAEKVNNAFAAMLAQLREAMPRETYAALFPDADGRGAAPRLVDPALMPASYEPFQEHAKV